MKRLSVVLLAAFGAPLFGGYAYYFTDPMQSLQTADWTTSGSVSFSSFPGGYWGAWGSTMPTMVSKVAVPDGSSSYGISATLHFPNGLNSGGTISLLLRASSTFDGQGRTTGGYILNFSCSPYSSTVTTMKLVSGTYTILAYASSIPCSDGMVVRAVVTDGGSIGAYVNGVLWQYSQDGAITSGSPGIVLYENNSTVVSQIQLGPADRIPPGPIPTNGVTYSVYPNHVDFQWLAVPDDANGSGVATYQLLRDGQYATTISGGSNAWSDTTVQPGTEYVYTFIAIDTFFNSINQTITITIPPTPGSPPTPPDGRRVGVRSTGAYWGASTEQIDVLSGNVNYTIPLLKAQSRTGWGVGFNLTYNSQNWRYDSGGLWNLGEDVGYGYGWKLLAGSLTPIWSDQHTLSYYSFVDSTGAEYRLTQNSGGVWTSLESVYVSFDSNANKVYFRDGSFWLMECTSATSEPDSGTKYPTKIEDTNGNQILVTYKAGAGLSGTNSSARISQVQDVRGLYLFNYNSDPTNHLTSITNNFGTAEAYTLTWSPLSLLAPFSPFTAYPAVSVLNTIVFNTTSQQHSFVYSSDSSGTLIKAVLPNGGVLVWSYQNVTYGNGATYQEISQRQLSKDGVNYTTYPFTYGSSPGNSTNQSTTITDPGGVGQKYWAFSQTGANTGMVTTFQGQQLPGPVTKTQNAFTWTQDNVGNLYIGSTLTTVDPGQSWQAQKKTDQTVDIYGNVLKVLQYDFNSLTTPSRIYTYTYLSSSAYTSRYIYNRMTQATLAAGLYNVVTLATNSYDAGTFATIPTGTPNWDSSYATVTARGDVTSYTSINDVGASTYDQAGNVTSATRDGVTTQVTTNSSTNYAAPSQLSVGSLTSSMDYSSFLGITSAAGPNGDTSSVFYDSSARPSQSNSPYGAVTFYSYSNSPTTTLALIDAYSPTPHFTKTILDGLGRTLTVYSGTASGCSHNGTNCQTYTTVSQVDTVYGSCACSPTGKMIQQSLPHAPNATPAWTTYTYDGIGRTLSVVAPDGHSTTTYGYYGIWVGVTDPAGKNKSFQMDAFGNLMTVAEPDPANPTTANYYTSYNYDGLNNLTSVVMTRPTGTQTRTFVYNGKLLTSATNPENGTVNYTYNGFNKVATKVDAKGQAVKYSYDSIARLTQVQRYPTGLSGAEDTCQQENYYYDSNNDPNYLNTFTAGRLTAVQYSAPYSGFFGSCATTFLETYGYSQAGSRTNKGLLISQTFTTQDQNSNTVTGTGSGALESSYSYDGEGRMTGVTYPGSTGSGGTPQAGATIGYGFDGMRRLISMTDGTITGATYDAANRLLNLSGNFFSEERTYNVMGQLTNIHSSISSYPTSQLNITYNYSSTQNNGKIISQSDNFSGEQVVYAYDSLNRLASAAATNGSWGQSYSYDGFGNLTNQNVTAGLSTPGLSVVYDASHNRQSTDCADANGNIYAQAVSPNTCQGAINTGTAYGFDVENRLTVAPGMTYAYAPGNKRVARIAVTNNGFSTPPMYTTDEITFWSVTGQKLATFNLMGNAVQNNNGSETYFLSALISSQNAYFGGRLVANNRGNVLQDRLGSVGKFYPWGQEKPSATTNGTEKFTGYFRDAETGLDYAKNRYHQPGMGRFLSADPYNNSAGAQDPGSWNRYAYTRGDPVNRMDRTGLDDDGFIAECQDDTCGGVQQDDEGGDWNYPYPCGENGLVEVPGEGCVAVAAASTVEDEGPDCNALTAAVGLSGLTYQNASEIWADGNLANYQTDAAAATIAGMAAITWSGESQFQLHPKNNINSNGTVDYGPFQINSVHKRDKPRPSKGVWGTNGGGKTFNGNPDANIAYGIKLLEGLYKRFGNDAPGRYVGRLTTDNAQSRETNWQTYQQRLTTLFSNQDCFKHQ